MPTLTMSPNTSAVSTTGAFTNGTLDGTTNVSQGTGIYNVHSLLYSGHTTKVLVHWIPWFTGGDDGNGVDVQYSTSNSTYLGNMLTDLSGRGVDGVIIDWMGQTDITDAGGKALQTKISGYSANGSQMKFAIMMDAQLLGNYSGTTNQTRLNSALTYLNTQYFGDTNYLTYNSKIVVFDFGLCGDISGYGTGTINWATVQTNYPNIQFVHHDNATSPDGFGITDSAGSFLWINPDTSGGNFSADQTDFCTRALTHTSQIAMGAAYKGFSNIGTDGHNYAPWDGSTRTYIDQNLGQTWLTSFSNINAKFSTTHQLPFLQLVTWDDYYEGTPLETGIDNGLTVSLSKTGTTPSATLNFNFSGSGNKNTLAEIQVWAFWNNQWGYTTWSTSTTSIPITSPNTYYVKLVGKPFIKNYLSAGLAVT